ncbi:MAG: 23S rRNA (cytosine1962-C5)-methyltransferase [Kiritimatiellia bacterium]|jgi:23S rRNA (cytosine1962-C5)-methyltransferase
MSMKRPPYELVDFGDGRKLERFADTLFDRPAPNAQGYTKAAPSDWARAEVRYERGASVPGKDERNGQWTSDVPAPESWVLDMAHFSLQLRQTPFGHLGVFPEQIANWHWIRDQVSSLVHEAEEQPVRVLNLFAYTGGSTLAAACAGAELTHVDAAKNIVGWARQNAAGSGLADAPVRWIVEDAALFVRREVKRGKSYEGIVLDPPSYGHGAAGQTWSIHKHLIPLLQDCGRLLRERGRFLLLTCHTPEFGPMELEALVQKYVQPSPSGRITAHAGTISSADGRTLPAGTVVRWTA